MAGVFKNKFRLYRILFSSILHCKSKFCQNGSLFFFTLALCDYKKKIFAAVKIKKSYYQKSFIRNYKIALGLLYVHISSMLEKNQFLTKLFFCNIHVYQNHTMM